MRSLADRFSGVGSSCFRCTDNFSGKFYHGGAQTIFLGNSITGLLGRLATGLLGRSSGLFFCSALRRPELSCLASGGRGGGSTAA